MTGICEHGETEGDCRLCRDQQTGSKSALSVGLVAPWDTLEEDKNDHFANYYAWEKWLQMQDRKDSLENLDMMEKTLLYAIMVDLLKGN